jgi:hypothetical protein
VPRTYICKWISVFFLALVSGLSIAENESGPSSRFAIKGSEVYDISTNLTWQRCSVGQRWVEGIGCVGPVKHFTLDEARKQAHGKWRVPTKGELASLIDQDRETKGQIPTIDIVTFPNMDHEKLWYWHGNSGVTGKQYVGFADGGTGDGGGRSNNAVRLVRSGH